MGKLGKLGKIGEIGKFVSLVWISENPNWLQNLTSVALDSNWPFQGINANYRLVHVGMKFLPYDLSNFACLACNHMYFAVWYIWKNRSCERKYEIDDFWNYVPLLSNVFWVTGDISVSKNILA